MNPAPLRGTIRAAACLLALAPVLAPGTAGARARVGRPAPWFSLQTLDGRTFTHKQLRGRPAVLVVGRTQRAAPPCKAWSLSVIRRHGERLPMYQVIVVDKSWFIPRGLVIGKVKDFVPRRLHHRVLLEWYTVFADDYGIRRHDDPVVLVLDDKGVVRWRHRGRLSAAAQRGLDRALAALGWRDASARLSAPSSGRSGR